MIKGWFRSEAVPVVEPQKESNFKLVKKKKKPLIESISKEDVSTLPLDAFEGEVIVVERDEDVESALLRLSKEQVIGFDTETRPSFKKGVSYKISLLQLSSPSVCVLFRLHLLSDLSAIDTFMSASLPLKVGVAIRDDIKGLVRVGIAASKSYVDLQTVVKDYGIADNSLQRIYAILYGKKLSKRQRLTNWEAQQLKPEQIKYAATDAWASLRIYNTLMDSYTKSIES